MSRPGRPAYREVTLTGYDLVWATSVGARRHIQALLKHSQNAHGLDDDDTEGWTKHIEGACGELAAAIVTGRHWGATVGTYDQGDDIHGCQVRTRSHHSWDLIIRKKDRDDAVFILVTGAAPVFRVHGWIVARDGKRDEYLQNHGGRSREWFVPQAVLAPIEQICVPDPLPDWLR